MARTIPEAKTLLPDRSFPILQGVLPIDPKQIPLDMVAGITLAALAIPEPWGIRRSPACRWSPASIPS